MLNKGSIFYYLTGENENACTQLLANMMETKYIRDIVLRFLSENKMNEDILGSIENRHITTQTSFSENGRPDIVIQNQKCCVYIENKILCRTGLTPNQPDGYFSELKKQAGIFRCLFFLLPDGYEHESVLNDRIQKLKDDARANNIGIVGKKWSDLFDVLSKAQIDSKSSVFKECLNYIRETVQTQTEENAILSTSETSLLYQSDKIFDIYNYLENIKRVSYRAIGNIPNSGIIEEFGCWGIGARINVSDALTIFVGLSPLIDESHSDFAFSICFWYKRPITNEFYYNNQQYIPYTSDVKEDNGYWTFYRIDEALLTGEKQDELNTFVCYITNNVMNSI
ncbi:MAG: PD-(D/E)XK nuclease family protein [Treponema sp.]|nr:PD-(D/E)XK nuclease family protein [Treponema sp.]